jgi:hypothetical protein
MQMYEFSRCKKVGLATLLAGVLLAVAVSMHAPAAESKSSQEAVDLARWLGTIENPGFASNIRQWLSVGSSVKANAKAEAAIDAWILEFLNSSEWRNAMVSVLSRHLSTEDMVAMVGILKDPAYQRYQAARESIEKDASAELSRMMKEHIETLQRRVREAK